MRAFTLVLVLLCPFFSAGCFGPIALHEAVLGYDETLNRLDRELILINIARSHLNRPTHFTATSSIVAAFNYSATASVGTNIFESTIKRLGIGNNAYTFSAGATAAELPTLSIVPVQGEEFTRRILTPMDVSKFTFLVFQGVPIDMVIRMMVEGIEVQDRTTGRFQRFIENSPAAAQDYDEFRRLAMHLTWLYDPAEPKIFIEALSYEETFQRPAATPFSVLEMATAADKGYQQRQVGDKDEFVITKTGRVILTNYDPRMLSNAERKALNTLAEANPSNYLLMDIRAGYPGGDFPMFGALKFRSFHAILSFIASGINRIPEYHVEKDPRTGFVLQNPVRTLATEVTDSKPADSTLSIVYEGKHYSVPNSPWDAQAFILLSSLYQMTVTDVSNGGIPITVPVR